MTLEDNSLSLKHAEVSLPVMVGLLQTSASARQMSCAYYVTFPDANLLTLEYSVTSGIILFFDKVTAEALT